MFDFINVLFKFCHSLECAAPGHDLVVPIWNPPQAPQAPTFILTEVPDTLYPWLISWAKLSDYQQSYTFLQCICNNVDFPSANCSLELQDYSGLVCSSTKHRNIGIRCFEETAVQCPNRGGGQGFFLSGRTLTPKWSGNFLVVPH